MEGLDTSELVPEYLEDARTHLDKLDSVLLELEKDLGQDELDVDLVSDLLGSLHTFKGNSGIMGFSSIQQYLHQLEGVLKESLEGGLVFDEALLQGLFEAAGLLRGALDAIQQDPYSPPDLSDAAEFLANIGKQATEEVSAERSGKLPRGISDHFRYISARSNVLKVDFERLDHLLNLAGELVIHRTRLAEVDRHFKEKHGDKDLSGELTETTELIHKATGDLQEAIMKVRMLPVSHVFQRFPRMVRDLSRERGKEILLTFEGEGTELDKTVIDEIGEPLLHLIRNAVDHGIEGPAERVRCRKSSVGTIRLSARQEGNHIDIVVADDGAGIDLEAVKAKAASVYSAEEIDAMGRDNLLEFIFHPGFSTAREVSEISGRGVGLDVVKKNIAALGGMVEVQSEQGRGTRFTIRLPLTLAIISALMVETAGETYALPLSSVVENLRLDPQEVRSVNGREVIRLRDRVLPLVRLSSLFGREQGAARESGRLYLVVVGRAEKRIGLVVDRLLGRQEIVIKALDEFVGEAEGVAGATILGDGRVVLILDVAGLVDRNMVKADRRRSQGVPTENREDGEWDGA